MPGPHPDFGSALRAGRGAVRLGIADPGTLLAPPALVVLRREAEHALRQLDRHGEVRVRLVADDEMAAAHQKFSGIPGTTDVLTFDLSEGATARGDPFDVDILACVNEARREAAPRAHAPERELLLYILHGALHCLGHDDHDDASFQRMHDEEDRILAAIGVGPIFARPGTPTLRVGSDECEHAPSANSGHAARNVAAPAAEDA